MTAQTSAIAAKLFGKIFSVRITETYLSIAVLNLFFLNDFCFWMFLNNVASRCVRWSLKYKGHYFLSCLGIVILCFFYFFPQIHLSSKFFSWHISIFVCISYYLFNSKSSWKEMDIFYTGFSALSSDIWSYYWLLLYTVKFQFNWVDIIYILLNLLYSYYLQIM